MSEFVSVIFCRRCGSRHVEVPQWSEHGKAVFYCRTCGNKEEMSNFTLGRASITKSELENAHTTIARKGRYER